MIFSRTRRIARAHARLLTELDATCALASDPAKAARSADDVSAWTVQQHLEHLLLADKAIVGGLVDAVEGRAQPAGTGRPTWAGYLVLWRRFIPRGRGRSPEIAIPKGLELNEVAAGLNDVTGTFETLEKMLPAPGAWSLHSATVGRVHSHPPRAPRQDHRRYSCRREHVIPREDSLGHLSRSKLLLSSL
jgi:hypothetical protein